VSEPSPTETEIPLFPLHTVLFPGGHLPLRIFEKRYLDMVRGSLGRQEPFGICLIRAGREVGEAADCHATGTEAHIVDFATLPGGLLGISVHGGRRFQVLSRRVQPDQLILGRVRWLNETAGGPAEIPRPVRALMEAGRQTGLLDMPAGEPDPAWIAWRAAELLPLSMEARQTLLEMDDVAERLRTLAELTTRLAGDLPGEASQ